MKFERNNNIADFKSRYKDNKEKITFLPWNSLCAVYAIIPTIAAFCCFINSFDGDFVHDDIYAIKNNADVLGKSPVWNLFRNDFWGKPMADNTSHKSYRPLTVLTFRYNVYLFGASPYSFHVVNVLLHAVMTYLFTYVCREVFRLSTRAAVLTGLLFAVHPVHTEAVSGIVGRADVLAGIAFLISFLLYVKSLNVSQTTVELFPAVSHPAMFVLSLVLSAAAMLFKEQGITVLAFSAVFDICVCCRRGVLRFLQGYWLQSNCLPLVRRMAFIVTVLFVLLMFRLQVMHGQLPPFIHQDNPASFSDSFLTRCLSYSHIWSRNALLLLAPSNLCYDWQVGSIPLVESFTDARNMATIAFFAVLSCLIHRAYRNLQTASNIPPDPVLIGLFLTILPFLPASNIFFRVGFVLAERILYIPSAGVCLLVGHGVQVMCSRWHLRQTFVQTAILLILLLFAAKTVKQNQVWRSRETLFRSGISAMSHNAKVHYNYANFLKDTGQSQEAIEHYRESLRLYPHHASAENNLGTLLENRTEAEEHFRRALDIHPRHAGAHVNLGSAYFKRGGVDEGVRLVKMAVEIDPSNSDALAMYGSLLMELGQYTEAERYYQLALEEKPDFVQVYNYYGTLMQKKGQYEDAVTYFQQAYELDSRNSESLANAAYGLEKLGRVTQAEEILKRAISLDHSSRNLEQLAVMYLNSGREQETLSLYQEIQRRDPNSTEAMLHYGGVLANMQQYDKAESVFQQVLSNNPDHVDALQDIAKLMALRSRFEQAISYLQQAITRARTVGDRDSLVKIYFNQGNIYKDMKKYKDAFESFSETLKIDPSHVRAHTNIGALHHMQGELDKARYHYLEVLKYQPDNAIVKNNMEKLDRLQRQNKQSQRVP